MAQDSEMEREELLAKRIRELADLADQRGLVTFTDFLNLNEQNILHQTLQKFSWIHGETFGGYEGAERCLAAFIPDTLYDPGWEYPIACIRIAPVNPRFAESLSHRDILGALMNLGIERNRTGDIAVSGDEAYLFCTIAISETICRELTRIRHTSVSCERCCPEDFSYEPRTQSICGSVASVRLDAAMALAFRGSRSSLLSLIGEGRVSVNGKLVTSNGYSLKNGDLISVRGMGKFRYIGMTGQTKKGRCRIEVQKYI